MRYCFVVLPLLIGMWGAPTRESSQRQTGDETASERATLFREGCGSCHGDDGSGNTRAGNQLGVPDLRSDPIQDRTEAQLIEAVGAVPVHASVQRRIGDAGIHGAVRYILTFRGGSEAAPQ
jgi:mono/diheme cytochrome c family protein